MNGPFTIGTHGIFPGRPTAWDWETGRLWRGKRYRVSNSFVDAEGDQHLAGEEWLFIGTMFSPHDEMMILCVKTDNNEEGRLPLLWMEDAQLHIIENIHQYVSQVVE